MRRIKIVSIIIVLSIICFNSAFAQNKLSIPGFGDIPLTKDGNLYSLNFGKLGKFGFAGSVDPLSLTASIGMDDLKTFPGAKAMGALGLRDIEMNVKQKALEIAANFDDKIKDDLVNELRKIEQLKPIIETIFNTLEIRESHASLIYNTDGSLGGELDFNIIVFGKKLRIPKIKGKVDIDTITSQLVSIIKKEAISLLANLDELVKGAEKIAKMASSEADKLIADAKVASKHTHSKGECDKKCCPKHAKKLSGPIIEGSFDAVRKFYFDVFPTIGKIHGATPKETRQMRSSLIKEDWDALFTKIDEKWAKILKDRTYVRFYIMPSSAANGGNIYRSKVKEYKKKDLDYRKTVWERMMTNTATGKEEAKIKGTKIPAGTYYIKSANTGNANNGYFDISYNREKKKWKMKGQRLQIWTKDNSGAKKYRFHKNKYLSYYIITPASDSKFALDCYGGKSSKKTAIHLWSTHKAGSQQFYLEHKGNGKFAIIPKRNHNMCLALVDNKNADKGNKVHLWTYSDMPSKHWYLINVKTNKKYIPKQ
ncbi:Ricin-type beta-trefoil lectin domain-containing protein [Polaribacter sp. KT25b]|uniref:RICIN domain-containing protein n=1 Tax=Polaribacter sp. KT25b TaxID=1855336 RepID=UPI00087A9E59|nr:RICIN domain-containing protein [Polaribacter sp. KT25b]SDR95155.1 Ricin-type beta-trefoil lectin domain-containing protein [Polaribacter sp. KT25b]